MGKRRRAGLLAAVFGAGFMAMSASAAYAETLAEAIALAYATNPNLLQARLNLRNADESYFRATRTLGPSATVDVTVAGNTNNDIINGGGGFQGAGADVNLRANQTLYSGGRLSANLIAEEASLQSAREGLRQTEMSIVQSVVAAYLAVRRAEQSLTISQENVRVLVQSREEALARFEVGQQTRTDLAQAEQRLAGARSALTAAQNNLDNERSNYRTIIGQNPGTLQPEPSLASALPASQAIAFEEAQVNNPAMRRVYLSADASAARVSAARAERRPQVVVSTGLNAGRDVAAGGNNDRSNGSFTTGLTFSIPIFTGFTTSSQIRSAQNNFQIAQVDIERQRRELNDQVSTAWNAVRAAEAQIVSQEEAVRASRLASEGVREEQQVGLRTTLDVLNAEQELRNAEQSLINARTSHYTSQVGLLVAMGKLTPELFGAQVERYDPKKHFEEVNDFALPWEPLVFGLDRIGAAPIPQRTPIPGEVVPPKEPLR